MNCKICNTISSSKFSKKILGKYEEKYYQCPTCEYLFLAKPHWLNEAYSEAITKLDIGLLRRNILFQNRLSPLIKKINTPDSKYLDYAGGFGIFTRLMRDKGFNFYHHDDFCKNIFAENFTLNEILNIKDLKFDFITAFEVFEHFNDPLEEINKMFQFSDVIIFSTELIPKLNSVENWWYLTPETGQHISFYSLNTINQICKLYNLYYQSDGLSLHVISKNKLKINLTRKPISYLLSQLYTKWKFKTLLHEDFNKLTSKV